jgi:hypothetical protein
MTTLTDFYLATLRQRQQIDDAEPAFFDQCRATISSLAAQDAITDEIAATIAPPTLAHLAAIGINADTLSVEVASISDTVTVLDVVIALPDGSDDDDLADALASLARLGLEQAERAPDMPYPTDYDHQTPKLRTVSAYNRGLEDACESPADSGFVPACPYPTGTQEAAAWWRGLSAAYRDD